MSHFMTLSEAAQHVRDYSSPRFVREQVIGKRQPFDVPTLQRIMQFVALQLQKMEIALHFSLVSDGREIFMEILELFPAGTRADPRVQSFVGAVASLHVLSTKATEALGRLPVEVRVEIAGIRYSLQDILKQGAPGSGHSISYDLE